MDGRYALAIVLGVILMVAIVIFGLLGIDELAPVETVAPTDESETAAPDVATNEPVATATDVPTETPEPPTPKPVPGIPLVWMLPLIEAIQAVEPAATYATGPCSDPEYSEFEECVTSVNFCPEGNVCTRAVMVLPVSALEYNAELKAYLSDYLENGTALLGGEHYMIVYRFPDFWPQSEGFLLSEAETKVIQCISGRSLEPGSSTYFVPFALWAVTDSISDALTSLDSLGLQLSFPDKPRAFEDCS